MFQTITREETLSSRVRERLEKLLIESRLQPGEKLPGERELASRFGVSRTVIREAVMALVARGMLEVRHGSGTTIKVPSVASLTPSMAMLLRGGGGDLDHRKVSEVRMVLEVEVAGLAAERRTSEELERLHAILEDQDGIQKECERFVAWDVAFHSALAGATHNVLFCLLLDSVAATMRKVREIGFSVPGAPDRALAHHQAIFTQVVRGDVPGARRAMRDHLGESQETLAKGLRRLGK